MKSIGGYFSLELREGDVYHKDAVALNNARAALQYVLRAKKYKKIYLPDYICGCVLQPITAENVEYEYYHINEKFELVFEKEISDNECFLYVNYFGINDANVKMVCKKYRNVIIDSTQAFYAKPEPGIDTIYSVRKFFGVADGGYLYTDTLLDEKLEKDVSYKRMEHLLKRIDLSAEEGYVAFQANESDLDNNGIKEMSNLTQAILSGIDYAAAAERRRKNFCYLHERLGKMNLLNLPELQDQIPMVYPFLTDDEGLRQKLIDEKIYVATYWPDVMSHAAAGSIEEEFVERLLALPIDQRYGKDDMEKICKYTIGGR